MNKELLQQALDDLENCAFLLGQTQDAKACGYYTQVDSQFELSMRQSIAAHRKTIESVIAQPIEVQPEIEQAARICDLQGQFWRKKAQKHLPHYNSDHARRDIERAEICEQLGTKIRSELVIAQPVEVLRVPLTNHAVMEIIHEKHFDKKYQLSQSDRNLLDWYRIGLRDGEQAHGIKPASLRGA